MNLRATLGFWNGMIVVAMAAMLGLLLFETLVPMPKFSALSESKQKADDVAQEQEYAFRRAFEQKRASIDSRVWKQSSDSVGALILDKATNMSRGKGLTLTAFRPQRPEDLGELTRLAYVMTLEGPYPGLLAMVRDLETPEHRVSVHMVQVASADEASDLVTATVGISAYVEKVKGEPAKQNGN